MGYYLSGSVDSWAQVVGAAALAQATLGGILLKRWGSIEGLCRSLEARSGIELKALTMLAEANKAALRGGYSQFARAAREFARDSAALDATIRRARLAFDAFLIAEFSAAIAWAVSTLKGPEVVVELCIGIALACFAAELWGGAKTVRADLLYGEQIKKLGMGGEESGVSDEPSASRRRAAIYLWAHEDQCWKVECYIDGALCVVLCSHPHQGQAWITADDEWSHDCPGLVTSDGTTGGRYKLLFMAANKDRMVQIVRGSFGATGSRRT
jgi:hypothetical protein